MGVNGLALATTVSCMIGAVVLAVMLRRRLGHIGLKKTGLELLKVAGSGALCLAAALLLNQIWPQALGKGWVLLRLAGIGCASLLIYVGRTGDVAGGTVGLRQGTFAQEALMRYDAVLFDIDDTLLDFQEAERRALEKMLRRYALYTPPGGKGLPGLQPGLLAGAGAGGNRPGDLALQALSGFSVYDEPGGRSQGGGEFYMNALSQEGVLLPGALEAVRETAARVKVGAVTNGNRLHSARPAGRLAPYGPTCPRW